MTPKTDSTSTQQEPYQVPETGCGGKECVGPQPVPWLHWDHCFKMYDFRYANLPLSGKTVPPSQEAVAKVPARASAKVQVQRPLRIRARYEHALCLAGRKQGPIIHSLTLLPKEEVRIYEYDRYKRSTGVNDRYSTRTSFYTMTQRLQQAYSSTKVQGGASASVSVAASASAGGGFDLFGLLEGSAEGSVSTQADASAYFNAERVSEDFSRIVESSSLAVESERSIVVSTFEEQENLHSTARTLRNDNECKAVTYYMRRVFEVYKLTTRMVGIDVLLDGGWTPVLAAPAATQKRVAELLDVKGDRKPVESGVEIALPTDGLLYEAELAHCCSCEPEREARLRLELERLQLENLNLRLEATRRQKRLDAGELDAFEPQPPAPVEAPVATP